MGNFIRYRQGLTSRARLLRKEGTPAERKLWYEFLRTLPEKFTRQKPLGQYIADFYCSSRRLDGDTHFVPDGLRHDAARSEALAALGIRVLRFTNLEVAESFEPVCLSIKQALES